MTILDFTEATRILERFRAANVLVIGDLMLDEYVTGDARRVSPEAPVPVVSVSNESFGLGGAANVANQIAALGATVELAGVVGDDDAGSLFRKCCDDLGVGSNAVIVDESRPTTRKMRVIADRQHVLRVDREVTTPLAADVEARFVAALTNVSRPDVIVVSDYAKGVVTPTLYAHVVALARSWRVPLLVDPKDADLRKYDGATLVKANHHELEAAVRRLVRTDDVATREEQVAILLDRLDVESLVVTMGEQGLAVFERNAPPTILPTDAEQVFDVSGAGDVVLAVLALGAAIDLPRPVAAHLGNVAAGIAVRRLGVSIVGPGELAARLGGAQATKVLTRTQLTDRCGWWRAQGRSIVITNGCFDLLHPGHLHLLRHASELGDALVVAVNSDRSIRDLKGPDRPLISEGERTALIAALACVDAVVVFEGPDLVELLAELAPDVLVKGADYRIDDVVGRETVEAAGGRVALIDLLAEHSTTSLVERIRSGDG